MGMNEIHRPHRHTYIYRYLYFPHHPFCVPFTSLAIQDIFWPFGVIKEGIGIHFMMSLREKN